MKNQILLRNANLIDVEEGRFDPNLDILVENEMIRRVGRSIQTEGERLTEIDFSGKFVLPGLFECHAHLALLTSKNEKTKKQIMEDLGTKEADELEKQVLKEFVVKGITQVRDVGGPINILKDLKNRISSGEFLGPDIFYAGPMLEKSPLLWEKQNKDLPGFTVAVDSTQDAKSIIDQVSEGGGSLVKTFNKFDSDVFEYLIEVAKEHNLPITHDPGTTFFHSIPMDTAIDLGIRCVEHAKAPWQVVLKKDLKSEHDSLVNVDLKDREAFKEKVFQLGVNSVSQERLQWLIDKMIQNEVYCCTTLHAFRYMRKQQSEESNGARLENLKILEKMDRYFTQQMIEQNVKILVGQDGLVPQFTFDEMRYLKEVGLSEAEIIKGAAIYPAQWLGVADRFGSVSPGKKANILILNENPLEDIDNIKSTYAVLKGGEIVFRE